MENQAENHVDLALKIGLLERDVAVFEKYFGKIDATIEKVGDATAQLTRMIALHNERIETSARDIDQLERKIEALQTNITTALDKHKEDITAKIDNEKKEANDRLRKVETWRYIVIGGAMVVMFFFNKYVDSYFQNNFWNLHPTSSITQSQDPQK